MTLPRNAGKVGQRRGQKQSSLTLPRPYPLKGV